MNDISKPAVDNVYGYILCKDRIKQVAEIFKREFLVDDGSVQFVDGVLKISTPNVEVDIKRKDADRWSFRGAIAGDLSEVSGLVDKFAKQLSWSEIHSNYEIYNDEFECIECIER